MPDRSRTLTALALLAATTTCTDPLSAPARQLYGSWTWVHSCGGFLGHCITPESVGYTERLEFRHLGPVSVAETWRDDGLYRRETFRLEERAVPSGTRS